MRKRFIILYCTVSHESLRVHFKFEIFAYFGTHFFERKKKNDDAQMYKIPNINL